MTNTTITVPHTVAEQARSLARHRGVPLSTYVSELVAADRLATFGDAPEPVFTYEADDDGKPTTFIILDNTGLRIPASLAQDFVDHVQRVATKGGASAELSNDGFFLRVERHGPAVVVTVTLKGEEMKWSAGTHRAEQVARALSDLAVRHGIVAKVRAAYQAAKKAA